MKKTLSIHLGRQLFVIEEDAYDKLQSYLKQLEQSLANEEGLMDIIEDIEMRFAELLHSYLSDSRKVVTLQDVVKAAESLGEPEMISDESGEPNHSKSSAFSEKDSNTSKRLFRDMSNPMVAGVCSGIAAYVNIDPVIIRIIFVIFGFMGFGVPVYIIFWLIVPSAKTPSERLQMRGKPVTVDSLKAEFESATTCFKEGAKNVSEKFQNNNDHIARQARTVLNIFAKIVGVFLLIGASIWLVVFGLVTSGILDVVPTNGDKNYASLFEFLQLISPDGSTFSIMWLAILLVGIAGPLLAITIGSRLLLRTSPRFFRINFIALPILLGIGVILGIISGIQTGRDYSVYAEVERQHITANIPQLNVVELPHFSNNQRIVSTGGIDFLTIEKNYIGQQGIHVKYRESKDTLFHVMQIMSAHGINRTSALKRSGHLQHVLRLEGTKLMLDPYYRFPTADGIRDQEVEIIIEIPRGKTLSINGLNQEMNQQEYNGVFFANEEFEAWGEDDY